MSLEEGFGFVWGCWFTTASSTSEHWTKRVVVFRRCSSRVHPRSGHSILNESSDFLMLQKFQIQMFCFIKYLSLSGISELWNQSHIANEPIITQAVKDSYLQSLRNHTCVAGFTLKLPVGWLPNTRSNFVSIFVFTRMKWLKWCCIANGSELELLNKGKYLWAKYTAYLHSIQWVFRYFHYHCISFW